MGFLDIVLGGLLGYGLIKGLKNGLFVEFGTFISLLIGLYAASKFSEYARTILAAHLPWKPQTIQIAAFIFTFILVAIGISFLAKILTSIVNFASLGIINTLAGGLLGMLKIVLIVGVLMSLFEKVNINNLFVKKETFDNSLFYNPIQKTASIAAPIIESGFKSVKELKN